MAPRTSWKGFLKLSLVSVPVKAYTANDTAQEVRLNQLHRECHARVKYKKVCSEHGELKSDEIVSGYEYAPDQYVLVEPEELAKLRPGSDRSVRIDGFVPRDEVDPAYLTGKAYYLLPDGAAGGKPYALLALGMHDAGVCAIAKVVISGREQLVKLEPRDGLLVMSVLQVARKVKARDEFRDMLPDEELGDDERALAQTLIDATAIDDFDYAAYRDGQVEALETLIRKKVAGEEIVQAPDPEEPKILNLMEALKKSVAEARAAGDAAPARGRGKKLAPSARGQRAGAGSKAAGTKKKTARKTAKKAASTKKKLAPSAKRKPAARRKKSG